MLWQVEQVDIVITSKWAISRSEQENIRHRLVYVWLNLLVSCRSTNNIPDHILTTYLVYNNLYENAKAQIKM